MEQQTPADVPEQPTPEDREAELGRREAALRLREMKADAAARLRERRLPVALCEVLRYESPEAMEASLAGFEEIWRQAVEEGVNERMQAAGKPPALRRPGAEKDEFLRKMRRAMGLTAQT